MAWDETAGDGAGDGGAKQGDRAARRAAMSERARQSGKHRRADSMKFLESLQATDEQRALVLEKSKAAAPILAEARRQARALVAQAMASASASASKEPASKEPASKELSKADRKAARNADCNAARQSVKAQLQSIRDQTRGQIDALAKDVVASLTPEQRQKLQDVAAKRGRTLDDARFTRLAAALISRPMTAAYLEARQAK
jgi:hypothetical protein